MAVAVGLELRGVQRGIGAHDVGDDELAPAFVGEPTTAESITPELGEHGFDLGGVYVLAAGDDMSSLRPTIVTYSSASHVARSPMYSHPPVNRAACSSGWLT